MRPPRLLVVADRPYAGSDERLLAVLRDLATVAADGAMAIQLRWKDASAEALRHLAVQARDVVPPAIPLFLNGSAVLAAELGYDGVHWPQSAIPGSPGGSHCELRSSAAIHDRGSLSRARHAGVDFAVFGSVYPPGSKVGNAAGLHALAEIAGDAPVPVVAIGGITPDRVRDCLGAGAHGVAVVSAILDAARPAEAAAKYLEAIPEVTR